MTRGESGPGVNVRRMTLDDYDGVLSLWTEADLPFRPYGRDERGKIAAEVEADTAVFLVAEREKKLIGVVLATHDGRKGWINRLAVAPEFQRLGMARLLVSEVQRRMEERGLEIFAALVDSGNDASHRFFEAIGYVHDPTMEYFSRRRSPRS